jgi:signal transduction histidine kinase
MNPPLAAHLRKCDVRRRRQRIRFCECGRLACFCQLRHKAAENLRNRALSGTLVLTMPDERDGAQPVKSTDEWPTFPTPPTGAHSGAHLLLGVAYLTTAAIYVAFLVGASDLQNPGAWLPITILFALFTLSIYLFSASFTHFWKRLAVLLFQIVIVFGIVLVGEGADFLPILSFIVVSMAYLSFSFIQASGLALLCLVTLFLAYLIVADTSESFAMLLPYGGGFAFFAVVSTALIQQQKDRQRAEQLLAKLEDAHCQLRAYATQIEALAVAEERNRLAREIHDSLGHYLTAMTMQLQAAGKLVAKEPERAAASIAKAEEMARESLAEVRRSVTALRASPVDTAALGDAIGELVQNLRDGGIAATFTVRGTSPSLPIQTKTTLYRAAQEGLTNVRKHANASAVEIELVYEPEQATLTIADNGMGQRGKESAGFGLLGLRERVTLLGGVLEAGDDPAGGFRLHVAIPLQAQGQEDE